MKSKKENSNPPFFFKKGALDQSLYSSHLIINVDVKAQYLDLFCPQWGKNPTQPNPMQKYRLKVLCREQLSSSGPAAALDLALS